MAFEFEGQREHLTDVLLVLDNQDARRYRRGVGAHAATRQPATPWLAHGQPVCSQYVLIGRRASIIQRPVSRRRRRAHGAHNCTPLRHLTAVTHSTGNRN
jgi:hypothetical protein